MQSLLYVSLTSRPFIREGESTVPMHACRSETHSIEFGVLILIDVSPSKPPRCDRFTYRLTSGAGGKKVLFQLSWVHD